MRPPTRSLARPSPVDSGGLAELCGGPCAEKRFDAGSRTFTAKPASSRNTEAQCGSGTTIATGSGERMSVGRTSDAKLAAISIAVGERGILPIARGASCETLVLADGFSGREPIGQGTGRRPRHRAVVLAAGASV